ncbi:DUF4252 domain-containing protein [Prolixibacteraceae bacterium JC049]|nr:DUF4252 domain-containing protein [Prolixibacteraceae bacterium JC049]
MVRIAFLIGVFISSLFGTQPANAQKGVDKLYKTYSKAEGFTSFSLSRNMVDILDLTLDNDEDEERRVTGDLNEIKVLYYQKSKGEFTPSKFKKEMARHFSGMKYKKVKHDDFDEDSDTQAEMFYRGSRKKVKEFHIIFYGEGLNAVVSFWGKMNVDNLKKLKETGLSIANK